MSINVGLGTTESYLRVAATTAYAWDYVITFTDEIQLYRRAGRPTLIVIYYCLSRYTTALYLVFSQSGYFTPSFSADLCTRWVRLSGAFRSIAISSTALIFIWRASTVWPTRWVKMVMWSLWGIATSFYSSTALMSTTRSLPDVGNCINGPSTSSIPSWVNWTLWCIFDITACAIVYLKLRHNAEGGPWQRFSVLFFRQSLGYMLLSVALYVTQAIFFALPPSLGLPTFISSLCAAFSAILAQRMVTSIHQLRGSQELREILEERQQKKRYSLSAFKPPFSKRATSESNVLTFGGQAVLPVVLHDHAASKTRPSTGETLVDLHSPPLTKQTFTFMDMLSQERLTEGFDRAQKALRHSLEAVEGQTRVAASRLEASRKGALLRKAASSGCRSSRKMSRDHDFLAGLNYLSPPTSLEASPANGTADPARRSQYDLSAPVDAGQVAAQLDAWTNVAFDFETFVGGPPPSFDRAFDHRGSNANVLEGGVFAPGNADLENISISTVSPTSILHTGAQLSGEGLATVPSMDLEVVSSIDSPAHSGSLSSRGSRHTGNHTTGVGTLSEEQLDDEANRRAYEEDKRRRNTAASARFRVKKKQREQALEQSAKELRDKVVTLEKEVESLKSENGWLRNLVLERGGSVSKSEIAPEVAAPESGTKRSRAKTSTS